MHFTFRNVNEAFPKLVSFMCDPSSVGSPPSAVRKEDSRNGPVLRVAEPVTVTYTNPRERVLFNYGRDCNPFFHLFEALWMLAGRNDVKPLVYYNPRMAEYSDDGQIFHGAYGHRWRNQTISVWNSNSPRTESCPHCGMSEEPFDQIEAIIAHLNSDPNSRREVLQVWEYQADLWARPKGAKDLPCNTQAYFSLRELPDRGPIAEDGSFQSHVVKHALDMTVCNRSNDLVWGMLGANVVHWSMLQEYLANCLANCLEVEVGHYHQFTNNLHVYTERFTPEKWFPLTHPKTMHDPVELDYGPPSGAQAINQILGKFDGTKAPYEILPYRLSLVHDKATFDEEVNIFIDYIDDYRLNGADGFYQEPFLRDVAQPMMAAFRAHKNRRYRGDNNAFTLIERVHADDWRAVGKQWLRRRCEAWDKKGEK